MSENKAPKIDLNIVLEEAKAPSQPIGNNEESTKTITTLTGGIDQEMPTVTSLLNRKKLSIQKEEPSANIAQNVQILGPSDKSVSVPTSYSMPAIAAISPRMHATNSSGMSTNTPPPFTKSIWVPKISTSEIKKEISLHKSMPALIRRDILGCLAKFYSEIIYFKKENGTTFKGQLGFVLDSGNPILVSGVKEKSILVNKTSFLKDIVSKKKVSIHLKIGAQDQEVKQILNTFGFDFGMTDLGIFGVYETKMLFLKSCTGFWICMNSKTPQISANDIKNIETAFKNLKI